MNSDDTQLRCVVIEDEDPLRQWLCDRLREFDGVEVVGEAASVNAAFRLLSELRPDGLFLDVKLQGGDAFQLLQRLKDNDIPIPPIVMTTGFDEYAITSINHWNKHVKKYLMKPFVEDWKTKLQQSIDAMIASQRGGSAPAPPIKEHVAEDHMFVKTGSKLTRINFEDLLWVEVAGGGAVYLVTDETDVKLDLTLTKTLAKLPSDFKQISREAVINKSKILRVDRDDRGAILVRNGKEKFLGIGDSYYSSLLKSLNLIK